MEYASLSAEYHRHNHPEKADDDEDDNDDTDSDGSHNGFVCSVFEVPMEPWDNDDIGDSDNNRAQADLFRNPTLDRMKHLQQSLGIPNRAFVEREDNFEWKRVPFVEQDGMTQSMGLLCVRSTDETYIQRWGMERFHQYYGQFGLDTIWNHAPTSGIRP